MTKAGTAAPQEREKAPSRVKALREMAGVLPGRGSWNKIDCLSADLESDGPL